MKTIQYILLFSFLLALSSCLPKPIVKTTTSEVTTSESKIVVRDTIIKVEQNNAALIASLEALRNAQKPTVYKQGRSTVSVQLVSDTIYAECQCDSTVIKAALFDRYFKEFTIQKTETETTKFKRANLFNTLGIIAFSTIILSLLGFVIKLVINGVNPFKKVIK